jgi:hypothetical protein
MKFNLFIVAAFSFLLSSCHGWFGGEHIHGDGNVKTEKRSVTSFTGVDVSGGLDIYVKQDSTSSVTIETDANLQQYIITRVEDGVLRIYQENNTNLDATRGIKIHVSNPSFSSFEASGACDIRGENKISHTGEIHLHASGASKIELDVNAPKVSGELTGASDIKLTGTTKDLDINASGASNAKCYELLTENANADLSGASSASIFASVKITGEASGASDLKYKGSAATVTVNTSGAGSVKKEN